MLNLELLQEQILAQNPTDQQRDAIFAEELEFLLRASPGSGKTWTSCRRFIWRGANWRYPVGGIALLSFTNAAIREFQAATIKIGKRDLLSDPNYVGTFDSFVERFILTPFGHLIIGSSKRPKLFMAPRSGDWKNSKLMARLPSGAGKKIPVPAWEIIPFMRDGKFAFKTSNIFGGKELEFSENNPINELMAIGFYTHSQRVYWACRLLFERHHIAELIAKRFPEIIVDEAQDTNMWLLILLNFLRDRGVRITLVGDPDQCIYEFSMADATSLPALKNKWKIPEKPLSKSFRCNNQIAAAVRNIGGNQAFVGCGNASAELLRPFILKEPTEQFSNSIGAFQRLLTLTGINEATSAIICRAHTQLETIRGEVHYNNLAGVTKELAKASFFRDCRKDYNRAAQIVRHSLRTILNESDLWEKVDAYPESEEANRVNLGIWRFVKSESGLPSVNLSGAEWIAQLRQRLVPLITALGIETVPNLNMKIRKTGLDSSQLDLPLFRAQKLFPSLRQETIHQVKGESLDAVLVLGSSKFWNSVVEAVISGENSEDRRLAYVAMTRARHLLVLGLPATHYDKHSEKWIVWGFQTMANIQN